MASPLAPTLLCSGCRQPLDPSDLDPGRHCVFCGARSGLEPEEAPLLPEIAHARGRAAKVRHSARGLQRRARIRRLRIITAAVAVAALIPAPLLVAPRGAVMIDAAVLIAALLVVFACTPPLLAEHPPLPGAITVERRALADAVLRCEAEVWRAELEHHAQLVRRPRGEFPWPRGPNASYFPVLICPALAMIVPLLTLHAWTDLLLIVPTVLVGYACLFAGFGVHSYVVPLRRFVALLSPALKPRMLAAPTLVFRWLRVRWPQDLAESLAHTCGVAITLQAFEALIVLNPPMPPPRTLHPPPRGVPGTVRIFLPCIFPDPDLEPNRSPTALAHHRNLEDRGWTLTYDRRVGLLATLHITEFDDPIVHATTRILPDLLSILYVTQAVPAARLRALTPLKELAPA